MPASERSSRATRGLSLFQQFSRFHVNSHDPGRTRRYPLDNFRMKAARQMWNSLPEWEIWPLPEMCAGEVLLDDISGKWVILTIAALSRSPMRFNQLRRTLEGVTQKSLTQVLRRLERSGMISRTVLASAPVAVEYAITPLGRTLAGPFCAIHRWTQAYRSEVEAARGRFDARTREQSTDPVGMHLNCSIPERFQ